MKKVVMYTDGACSGNPGIGGWAVVMECEGHRIELSGNSEGQPTTNIIMELTAFIKGLEALKQSCIIDVYTDLDLIYKAFEHGWAQRWIENDWRTSTGTEVKNVANWKHLLDLAFHHNITVHKVAGHAGVELNERCDQLAKEAIKGLTHSKN